MAPLGRARQVLHCNGAICRISGDDITKRNSCVLDVFKIVEYACAARDYVVGVRLIGFHEE
jgi:hypothetical protein